ncbi:unnamed protein product [Paramecium sonneborni]|uniref:Uncharacterized protein n=1 Tax=Paramecium sonneborni TaxID=65129 RepID=A0A8S1PQT2_9CILI|nr:unnamed protein product [Paramecium sonneborni]
MMGIVIQIFQEEFPDTYIDKTFFKNQLRIILTPAEGLLLNRINLEGYNAKFVILQRLEIEEEDQIKIEQFRPSFERKDFNIEEDKEDNKKAENDD